MKIKVWAFVLIIVLTVAVSSAGTFAAVKGVSAVSGLISELRGARAGNERAADVSQPEDKDVQLPQGGNRFTLPANFNAGVSIPGTYGQMTDRTEDEVLSAAEQAGTSTWGLALKEGRLDELKQKVLAAVTESLKQMVSKGTISQEQSDYYMDYVTLYLEAVEQMTTGGTVPGNGGGPGNWWSQPDATAGSESFS